MKRRRRVRTELIFPTIIIMLDVCAALPYAWHANWNMAFYWLSIAILSACVTYLVGDL